MDINLSNSEWINSKYSEFYETHLYIPEMFNAYNCCEIIDIAPTLTATCGSSGSSGTVLIICEN